jgi:hypothetical protein
MLVSKPEVSSRPERSEWRDLLFILRSIQFEWKRYPLFCHPDRSGDICGFFSRFSCRPFSSREACFAQTTSSCVLLKGRGFRNHGLSAHPRG